MNDPRGGHDNDDPHAPPEELAPLLEALKRRGTTRAELAAGLAVAAYRRAPEEGRRRLRKDPEAAAGRVAHAFELLDERRPGVVAVRVFNPTADTHGWTSTGTIVELNVEDSPFLLSTVVEELARHGYEAVEQLHPIIGVRRGDDGSVEALEPARTSDRRESFMHLELAERLSEAERAELERDLQRVLADAKAATRDFQAMRQEVGAAVDRMRASAAARYDPEEVEEAAALLEWLLADHFVLLGYREYELVEREGQPHVVVRRGSGLGILADESQSTYAKPVPLAEIPDHLGERITSGELLTVARTNRKSTVHKQVRMMYLGVKRVDEDGTIVGEDRLVGLFAQKAFAEPASVTPVLRRKLRQILEAEDIVDHSHDERTMRTLFEAFPKHELFAADTAQLRRTLRALMESQQRQRLRVLSRVDPGMRGVSILVALPRERFNAQIRQRVQSLLVDRYNADAVDYHLSMGDRDQALMHFLLHVDPAAAEAVSGEQLEQDVVALTRTWDDRVADALVRAGGDVAGTRLARRWDGRFPPGYQDMTAPMTAVADIDELETLLDRGDTVRMELQQVPGNRPVSLRFKLYKAGAGVELSSFVPILESLGLVVVEEVPHEVAPPPDAGIEAVYIHDFGVRVTVQAELDAEVDGDRLAAAAMALWAGRAEIDSLNRLVLVAGLDWDDVAVLRAYRRYRNQLGTTFTESYQNDALVAHPAVAQALVALFETRFNPDLDGSPDALRTAREQVRAALDGVERLDQDRILRSFNGMIAATVRTNRYVERTAERGSPALALKIDSANLPEVSKPVPYAEVFVYSPDLEGVHLRGGPVARGGVRWSDRQEDVRAEVLGLMKSQMVKNAVIVPTGAKGGFVLKRPPAGDALREAVRRQYEHYIMALLDITGNVVEGKVVPPPRVRRLDGDDPYLVVAADRGTATYSDLANRISVRYGFWLGDAFASGGSTGYDHKEMGITARGAWVAVQRHFRELGVDVQSEPVTVVGIGDMSGDVFGNGMLCSRALKLVAAFDHRHIFIDPEPDPEIAFRERERLFNTPGSTWQDYDADKLSSGGGVWSRTAKSIALPEEARGLLRLTDEEVSPPELVRAILRAPVDLLFAGGIGTFVKAARERDAEVGDRANDAVRIDASNLGARVVAEGANLALTQRARIQYVRRGGRCNTDAIDNCAGVNTSDREVNLKILLRIAEERGRLDTSARDALLAAMSDDVAGAVLRDSYLQTWAISQELHGRPGGLDAYEQLMVDLETAGGEHADRTKMVAGRLDRELEVLPSSTELRRRAETGAGLSRPELAVLVGYAKVDHRTRLLASELPDQAGLASVLEWYFPARAVSEYGDLLRRHRLRRDLLATVVANDIVNRMGSTYVSRVAHEFGCMAWEVAAAYLIARAVTRAEEHWRSVEELDGWIDTGLQLDLKAAVDRVVNACTRAYLRAGTTDVAAGVERDAEAFTEFEKACVDLGPTDRRRARRDRVRTYTDLGIEEDLASRLVDLGDQVIVPDVAGVARRSKVSVRHVADVFFHLSDALPMERLFDRLVAYEPRGQWERWQQQGLLDELRETRRDAALQILLEFGDEPAPAAVADFVAARRERGERLDTMLSLLEREADDSLAPIAVTVRSLRQFARPGQ